MIVHYNLSVTLSVSDITGTTHVWLHNNTDNCHIYLCSSLLCYVSQVTALQVTRNNTTVTGGYLIIYMTSLSCTYMQMVYTKG